MIVIRHVVLFLVIPFLFFGCAGYVGGDLEGIKTDLSIPYCYKDTYKYVLYVDTEAEHDASDSNLSGYISLLTLGIIPTYWVSFETSSVEIKAQDEVLYSRKDDSRIHKFYGILWPFILNTDGVNALNADEGAGLRIPEGIKSRSIGKTLINLPKDIDINQLCAIRT